MFQHDFNLYVFVFAHRCFGLLSAVLCLFQFVSQPNSSMEASEVGTLIRSLQGVAAEMDKDTISQVHRACGVIEKMAYGFATVS